MALGVVNKGTSSKSRDNYQDSVTAPVDREYDNELVDYEDPPAPSETEGSAYGHMSKAIEKHIQLRKIIRAVRASPQRRQAWLDEVRRHPELVGEDAGDRPLMLILDVPTRWSSTHQMLRRSCTYHEVIDKFVTNPVNRDLRHLEISFEEWEAIAIVTKWLRLYRDATVDIGLQEHLRECIRELPESTPRPLRDGLINAHYKLSDYSYLFEGSPFYTWASPMVIADNLLSSRS
ncbi:hypothetical protein BD310DRAFT_910797 [Dichomitus squalens]|uniref:Uncharacterized protein n=1 Tax=Dichomitus squalens TaxID=114155 RepID=A0A4Q9PDU6_9APHY|nr:hypothetical protein BD310DRAFT_910797 [Dichomitus squalens]